MISVFPPPAFDSIERYEMWLMFNVSTLVQMAAMGEHYAGLVLSTFNAMCDLPNERGFEWQFRDSVDMLVYMWPEDER